MSTSPDSPFDGLPEPIRELFEKLFTPPTPRGDPYQRRVLRARLLLPDKVIQAYDRRYANASAHTLKGEFPAPVGLFLGMASDLAMAILDHNDRQAIEARENLARFFGVSSEIVPQIREYFLPFREMAIEVGLEGERCFCGSCVADEVKLTPEEQAQVEAALETLKSMED